MPQSTLAAARDGARGRAQRSYTALCRFDQHRATHHRHAALCVAAEALVESEYTRCRDPRTQLDDTQRHVLTSLDGTTAPQRACIAALLISQLDAYPTIDTNDRRYVYQLLAAAPQHAYTYAAIVLVARIIRLLQSGTNYEIDEYARACLVDQHATDYTRMAFVEMRHDATARRRTHKRRIK